MTGAHVPITTSIILSSEGQKGEADLEGEGEDQAGSRATELPIVSNCDLLSEAGPTFALSL